MTAKPVPEHISDERLADLATKSMIQATITRGEVAALITELQHRREAEAWKFCPECGCEDSHDAEGSGIRFCVGCGQDWHSDVSYLDVVAQNLRRLSASPSSPASGVRVKAITWQENGATSIWSGELVFGVYYTIYNEGTGWRVFWRQFLSESGDTEIAYAAKLDDAKEAAQAHFDAAILSARGEHP